MTEVILQVYPTLGDEAAMAAQRPIGRNNDAYQKMLAGLIEVCQAADDLGYWGITHVEHHMHTEGMEISPAPLMLNVHLGHYTKRLRHGRRLNAPRRPPPVATTRFSSPPPVRKRKPARS